MQNTNHPQVHIQRLTSLGHPAVNTRIDFVFLPLVLGCDSRCNRKLVDQLQVTHLVRIPSVSAAAQLQVARVAQHAS